MVCIALLVNKLAFNLIITRQKYRGYFTMNYLRNMPMTLTINKGGQQCYYISSFNRSGCTTQAFKLAFKTLSIALSTFIDPYQPLEANVLSADAATDNTDKPPLTEL